MLVLTTDADVLYLTAERTGRMTGSEMYESTCQRLGVVPVSQFLLQMDGGHVLSVPHRGIGAPGAQALAMPLLVSS